MSTLDTVFIIITAVCISLFFVIASAIMVYACVVFRRVVKKAEAAYTTVEEAGELIARVGKSGGLGALFKVIGQLIKLGRKLNKWAKTTLAKK